MTTTKKQSMQLALQKVRAGAVRHVPILSWARSYPAAWLRPDLISAATGWGLMVPVAIAYAELAGVPAQVGLYTAFAGLLGYALFGTSRHLKVTTSSTMAIMSAAVVLPLAAGDATTAIVLSASLALIVGIYLVVAGILKLGFISDFLAKSVITGFVFGLALNIIVGQLPKILGVPGSSGNFFQQVGSLLLYLPEANPVTTALGVSAFLFVFVMKRRAPLIPAGLIAIAVGIVIVSVLNLDQLGVAIVGVIPTGAPTFSVPRPGIFTIPYLAAGAFGIVFLAVGESLSTGRAFAARLGYQIDPDQELLALGAANINSGMFGGFTVDMSLSNTAAGVEAGGKSQLSSLVTSGLVLLTVLFLAPLFTYLPQAILGAIVIASVMGLLDVNELKRYLAVRRTDFWLALLALFGVLLTDVLTGLAIAVLMSLLMVLYRASRPSIVVVGRVRGEPGAYSDVARNPDNEQIPGLIIFRMDAPLYFFNSNVAHTQISDRIAATNPPPKAILLDIGATNDLDVASLDTVGEMVEDFRRRGLNVGLVHVRGGVRDRLRKTPAMDTIGADHIFMSIEAGVQAYLRHFAAPASSDNAGTESHE